MKLQDLCQALREEMGENCLKDANVEKIIDLLNHYQSNEDDFKQYVLMQEGKYTRNLVDDGNGKYNLMVLCWPAGKLSLISRRVLSNP
jgi:cysteine dioxygenase